MKRLDASLRLSISLWNTASKRHLVLQGSQEVSRHSSSTQENSEHYIVLQLNGRNKSDERIFRNASGQLRVRWLYSPMI